MPKRLAWQGLKPKIAKMNYFPPPLPLFLIQPILNHIVSNIAKKHPELFDRLGENANRIFMIDISDLPLFLILKPNRLSPTLTAHNQREIIAHDTYIAGSLSSLLRLIDAKSDSDALFFNREIIVSGDSEAMVALRNALDDMEGSLAQEVASSFGRLSNMVQAIMQKFIQNESAKNG